MTEARGGAPGARPAKSQAKLKVLIVDPNPNHRDRLKDLVRQLEFVDTVSDRGSPHSILDILAQNPVHVLMIDQNPGAGDVFEIVKAIRGKSVGADLRFVLIGDDLDADVQRQGTEVGISAFLQRPYDLLSIEQTLMHVGGISATQPDAPQQSRARDGLRDTLDKLRKVSLFSGFSDPELVRLLKICRTRHFAAGSYVFHEGEKGTTLYVIVAGKLEIRTKSDGDERVLVSMSAGDCFGEMAIIDAEPRSADAVAATDCTVIEVNESVVNSNSDVLSLKLVRQIAILLAKKLRLQSHPGPH
jgi:CRP/FNR family transcriptional regulator, cyclic AMP receptor protein